MSILSVCLKKTRWDVGRHRASCEPNRTAGSSNWGRVGWTGRPALTTALPYRLLPFQHTCIIVLSLTIPSVSSLQQRLLTNLGEDMDVTQTRLKAAQKRMSELIKKSGGMTQLCVVVVLSIILVVLVAVAFMWGSIAQITPDYWVTKSMRRCDNTE